MAAHNSVVPATVFEAHDSIIGQLPWRWYGTSALDGTASSWAKAQVGSEYTYNNSGTITKYIKTANNQATADWRVLSGVNSRTGFVPISLGSLRRVVGNDVVEQLYNKKLVTQSIPLTQLRRVVANDVVEPLYNNRIHRIDIPLASLRETSSNDIINAAGIGGILSKDSTPNLEHANGDTDSQIRLDWAASNSDPLAFQVSLPSDLDVTQDMILYVRAESAGTTDVTTVIDIDTFFNEGDTKVEDATGAITAAVVTVSATIATADIPAAAAGGTMSVEMTLGAHTTDVIYVYAVWLEVKVSSTPRLEYANGDTDSAHRVTWPASSVVPVTFQMSLPPDFDAASDIIIRFLGDMSGATDTPTLAFETYFDVGDTKVSDTSSALGSTVAEDTVTIAAADFDAGVDTMTVEITPGSHTTDDLYLYDLRVEYKVGSSPSLAYANGDTDSGWLVTWAASDVTPLTFQVALPPDLDEASAVEVHFRAKSGGSTDTPVLDLDSYFNEGDTKVEDASSATTSSFAEYTITIAAADVPSGAQVYTGELTPAAHTTDTLVMSGLWVEFTRT